MRLAQVLSRAQCGLDAPEVNVEVHLSGGLPSLSIVGLPETAVKESKDRVRSAIQNSGFEFPRRRITINLAPADLKKEGGRFDLPIALGILAASGQLPAAKMRATEYFGELSLGGELRGIRGALSAALAAGRAGHSAVMPMVNGCEAALAGDVRLMGARHLLEVVRHVTGEDILQRVTPFENLPETHEGPDLADVIGQHRARRALEIAAAGGHSLLMIGPPGTGKSMLAARLPGVLPTLSDAEALEVASIRSVAGHSFNIAAFRRRPFRSPHHTASPIAMVGGGTHPRPGEISLAHNGVLFLDELPEFDRRVLEVLREPMETGCIHISRAAEQATYPARFQLIAAMNPCPCGFFGDPEDRCRCAPAQIRRYRNRLSGPVVDRIDLHVNVSRIAPAVIVRQRSNSETTAAVTIRVVAARTRQLERQGTVNAVLSDNKVSDYCRISARSAAILEQAISKLGLSARGYQKIVRLARTIADLANEERISLTHVSEAIGYRQLDRRWNDF